jgi:hypothetical protein
MLSLHHTLISDDIIEKNFVCELNQCKGACCVEGDSGAPLEPEEILILKEIYPLIKPYLTDKGMEAIELEGTSVKDMDGDWTTPCVDKNKACAYAVFENGKALCGIEKAYADGVIGFQKPISCHLYPIRLTHYPELDVLNYDRWNICSPACALGDQLKVPVYQFLKSPLIRKFGQEWYDDLEKILDPES